MPDLQVVIENVSMKSLTGRPVVSSCVQGTCGDAVAHDYGDCHDHGERGRFESHFSSVIPPNEDFSRCVESARSANSGKAYDTEYSPDTRHMSTVAPVGSLTESDATLITAKAVFSPTLDAQSFLKSFVYTLGHQTDSYLATAPGRESFWSTDYGGLISYMRVRRHVLVSGGLIAPLSERPRLLMQFLKFVESRHWRATFFCIPEIDLPFFREAGYRINKLGEDAVIDLENVTFTGKSYEWVRRQSNYCKRHGVWIEELRPFDFTQTEWAGILNELDEVCRDGMQEKAQ
jgi:hypothetical protein